MDFEVLRAEPATTRVVERPRPSLRTGQARLHVEGFGLSANNLTYADNGDTLSYWRAFPTDPDWGRIPAWGVAAIDESAHPELEAGTRVFGLVPMSDEFVVTAGRVSERGFSDQAPHRSMLAGTYNRYTTVRPQPADGEQGGDAEGLRCVLQPLFSTAFLLADHLAEERHLGAEAVVLTSASSRTATATAFSLRQHGDVEIIGLTAPDHVAAVDGFGLHDQVLGYDQLDQLARRPTVVLDVAGGASLHVALRQVIGESVVGAFTIGNTHRGDRSAIPTDLPGAPAQFFFAPSHAAARTKAWGRPELEARLEAAWQEMAAWAADHLTIRRAPGLDALEDAYRRLHAGTTDPTLGEVHSLGPADRPDQEPR